MNSLNRFADTVYCIGRLIIGLMFACHGGQKILGFPPGGHGAPEDMLGMIGAWIELAGGFLIAFGLLTRLAAFIASGEMAVGYFMVHAKMGYFPIQNHGEAAVFYCWFFLFVLFYGAGRLSIDAMFRKGKAAPSTTSTA
jgi:putative oxidoreductase